MLGFRRACVVLLAAPSSLSEGLLWGLHVSCLLLVLYYEVTNLRIKSGAWGDLSVGYGGCKRGQEASRMALSSFSPKIESGDWRNCRDAGTDEGRRVHPRQPFCCPAQPGGWPDPLSLPMFPPHCWPPPGACQESNVARRPVREAGVSKHSLTSLAVSEHNKIQQHAATWTVPLPVSFGSWKMRMLQRSLMHPQLRDAGYFVTWQWPLAACPCWLGAKVCFTGMLSCWRWKRSQRP